MQSWPTSSIESWKSALFPRPYGVHEAFLEFLCWNWSSYRLETCVSGNLGSCLKAVKGLVMYDGEPGIPLKIMKGKRASSRVNLGYTELFYIPVVTSLFFSSCDSVLGDSLVFRQATRGSLPV